MAPNMPFHLFSFLRIEQIKPNKEQENLFIYRTQNANLRETSWPTRNHQEPHDPRHATLWHARQLWCCPHPTQPCLSSGCRRDPRAAAARFTTAEAPLLSQQLPRAFWMTEWFPKVCMMTTNGSAPAQGQASRSSLSKRRRKAQAGWCSHGSWRHRGSAALEHSSGFQPSWPWPR